MSDDKPIESLDDIVEQNKFQTPRHRAGGAKKGGETAHRIQINAHSFRARLRQAQAASVTARKKTHD